METITETEIIDPTLTETETMVIFMPHRVLQ